MNETAPTLILGGGLAGLSAAFHLPPERSPIVVEREPEVGGTARSFFIDGFTFDFTGHLLHLHHPYSEQLVRALLKGNIFECERKAWVFSRNTYTRYPFQANTFGLPAPVVEECVLGFLETYVRNRDRKLNTGDMNFDDFCRLAFGAGISKHFMVPYNEKLYQTPVRELTADWCGPFVPRPALEEVIRGALRPQTKRFGYNTRFLYPRRGGIQVLAQAFAKDLPSVRLGVSVEKIDWRQRRAFLSDGTDVLYRRLINSIPLLELLKAMPELPADVRNAADRLRFVSVLCLNIGVARAQISDKSWIYFPEKEFPFYRVGFPMNFTPHVVPKGCSSMYVEVPLVPGEAIDRRATLRRVRLGLEKAGILKRGDRLPVVQFLPIRYAYVVFNRDRRPALATIFRFLEENGIQSIGRYGAWKYSFMEEAILDGKAAADAVR